jgi:hypothetical protein
MAAQRDGYFYLQRRGERYIHVDVTPDEVAKLQSFISGMLEFARNECHVSGLSSLPCEAELHFGERIGMHNLHTALLARELGMPVLSDDGPLSGIFASLYGTQQLCTQAVWQRLARRTVISEPEYLNVLCSLLRAGYTFVRIQTTEFYRILERENFQLSQHVRLAFETLSIPEVSMVSMAQVGAWVLGSIFLEPLPLQTKRNMAFFVLRCICQSHGRTAVLVRVRILLQQRMARLAINQLKQVFQAIADYENSASGL